MIQAIFFDIDGTLIPHGDTKMPTSTIEALNALKEKGIKLFIATGRPPNSIDHIRKMFDFDGYLTANGQYCFNNQEIIFEKYIPKDSFAKLIPYLEEEKIPALCALLDTSYRNYPNPNQGDDKWPIVDFNTLIDKDIIQIMAYIPESQDDIFLQHLPLCKSARWIDTFADIIPEDGGKDRGIDHIIKYYNIPLENVMAFGDGGNDLTMLRHVPYGIAMGNANDTVKQHASYVTSDIYDDGILNALKHFGVL